MTKRDSQTKDDIEQGEGTAAAQAISTAEAPRRLEFPPQQKNCGNCGAFKPSGPDRRGPDKVVIGVCRRRSPQVLLIGMQVHPVTQQQQPMVDGYFPMTTSAIWCHDHLHRNTIEPFEPEFPTTGPTQ